LRPFNVVVVLQSSWTLGRSADAEVILEDVNISRRHATIQFKSGTWTVTDQKVWTHLS
jgi:pSer/pThr/pTyr-binding forkhead associated (FHA) protein